MFSCINVNVQNFYSLWIVILVSCFATPTTPTMHKTLVVVVVVVAAWNLSHSVTIAVWQR